MSTANVDPAAELRSIFRGRLERLLDRLAERIPPDTELSQRGFRRSLKLPETEPERPDVPAWERITTPWTWHILANLEPESSTLVGEAFAEMRQGVEEPAEQSTADLWSHVAALKLPDAEAAALARAAAKGATGRTAWPTFHWRLPINRQLWTLAGWAWALAAPDRNPWGVGDDRPLPLSDEECATLGRYEGLPFMADTWAWLVKVAPEQAAAVEQGQQLTWNKAKEQTSREYARKYGRELPQRNDPPDGWIVTLPGEWRVLHAAWLELHPEEVAWTTMERLAAGEKAAGDPAEVHRALAAEHAGPGPENEAARNALARELLAQLQAFHKAHMAGPPPVGPEASREALDGQGRGLGLLWLDEEAARFLEGLPRSPHGDPAAMKHAEGIREKARRRWAEQRPLWPLWLPDPQPYFARALAEVLWLDVVQPRLERLGTSAVPRSLIVAASSMFVSAKKIAAGPCPIIDPQHVEPVGTITLVENWLDALAPRRSRAALDRALLTETVLQALDTVAAARLPRLISDMVNRAQRAGLDPKILEIEHGIEGLGAALMVDPDNLSDVLDAYRIIKLPLPDGSTQSGLLLWNVTPASRLGPAILRIEPAMVWIPGYVAMLKARKLGTAEDRRLVFLSPPERNPPHVGSGRAEPAQERLGLVIHREFADRSDELAGEGGLPDRDEDWRRWCDEAGVGTRRGVRYKIRERWTKPVQAPFWPLFEVLPSGLLRLADEEVHRCLVKQGAQRNSASKAGKAPRDPEPWKKKRKRKGKEG